MERRYLVAALAIIATFAITSRGFRALEHLAVVHAAHAQTLAAPQCPSSMAARALAKIHTHLRPRIPEEAQLLAEMNAPLANMQSTIAEQMTRQNQAIEQGAPERAMRDAERAYRDAMRLQEQLKPTAGYSYNYSYSVPSVAISGLSPDAQARIQEKAAAIAAKFAANSVKLQIGADRFDPSTIQVENMEVPVVDVTDDGGHITTHVRVHTHANCKTSRSTPNQRQPE
jgi:hypothetical protein